MLDYTTLFLNFT